MAVAGRDQQGRVRSSYDERGLIDVVRDVVTAVDSDEPETVSQRRFDAARAGAGHPDAPTARAICMRLTNRAGSSMPWAEVLALALAETDPGRTLNLRGREAPADYMGVEHLVYGLRRAVAHLGLKDEESMGPDLYEKARRELIALAARRGRKRQFAELLPTVGQIEGIVKAEHSAAADASTWNEALALAELPVRPDSVRPTGLPIHLAAHHFLEYNGLEAWPSKRDLKAFAKLAGFSLAQAERPLTEDLAMARAHREELGLPSPTKSKRPSRAPRPEIKAPADGIPGAPKLVPRVQRALATEESCVESIRTYLDELEPGVSPSKKSYLVASVGRPDLHSPRSFDDFGGWTELLDKAREPARKRSSNSRDSA